MCLGGSAPKDNSGQIAADQEAKRQANIKAGIDAVNRAFDGYNVGTNAATSFTPGTTYYNADGTAYVPPDQAAYNTAFPASSGVKPGEAGGTPPSNPSYADWLLQQENNAATGGKLFTGTQHQGGAFGDAYYNDISDSYGKYYNPQLDQQFQNALNSLTYQLGQQGILQSSEGDRQLALLRQSYDTNKQTVASNAKNAAAQAKQNVANQKNALLAQAQQAGDPSALGAQAAETASSIASPVSYSPLGSVFAGLLGQGTNALSIQQGGLPQTTGNQYSAYVYGGANNGNNGSSSVVRTH